MGTKITLDGNDVLTPAFLAAHPELVDTKVTVADDAARFALTTAAVQNGDFVFQTENGVLYEVIDETHLGDDSGYNVARGLLMANDIIDSTPAGRALLTAAGAAAARAAISAASAREIKTANFAAEINGHYTVNGTVTVTDPTGTAAGQIYSVLCGSGTATIGGTAYSPSRLEIVRYYNGSAWSTLTPTITDSVTLGSSLVFEGATVDANKTTVSVVDPTASRTITLPNATGTVMLGKASLSRFASEMATYSNNAKTVASFGTASCVQFNDGANSAILELLLNPAQWAGKTVRIGAILAVNGTSAGNLRLRFRGGYCNAAALNGIGNGGYMMSSGGNVTGVLGDGVSEVVTGSNFAAPTTSGNPLLVESGNITIPSTAVQIFFGFGAFRANAGDTNTDTLYIHEIRVTEQ